MAFKARLDLSDKEYGVLHCSHSLNRYAHAKGRPFYGQFHKGITANNHISIT